MIRDVIAKILSTSLAGLGASLLPSLSFGLGLGDIQVESRLNQPLYARVEVVDVSDDDWREIRARIAPRTLLSEGSLHPEILASLTLRAVEDSTGRHFIEVKSGEVLTEPLFDLPVEVAARSLQMARNYSVLLDPATSEDAPRDTPAMVAQTGSDAAREGGARSNAGALATSGQYAAVAQVDAQAHAARRHRAHGAHKHSKASRKVSKAANTTGASNTASEQGALGSALPGQGQLEGQLETMQQTLTRMQATIASQDVEIAKLTAQIAVRGDSQASRRPSTWVEYPAGKSAAPSENASDSRSGWLGSRSALFYWIGGAVVGSVVLAAGVVSFLRWRHAKMLREIAQHEAARRQSPPRPAEAATSEQDLLAWQSNLRAAQSRTRKESLEDTFDPTSGASRADSSASDSEAPDATITQADWESSSATPASASEDTAAVTVAIEELPQDLETDLEGLNASYEAEYLENSSSGMAAWRTQNEMLERDYLADTEALPYVLESDNQAKVIDTEPDPPAARRTAAAAEPAANDPAGTRNREVAEILERSLTFEPDRIDIQLKLLEIYHHEALGNRGNFESLLRKVEAASQQLSPAQRLHLEMLQSTLREGKDHTDDSDFVADVAI